MESRPAAHPGPPSYLGLLTGNRDYRNVWLGEVVSFLGDWFSMIALYTIVQELSDSTRAVALVLIAKTLPIFLVMPVAGPLIDRFDRRKLMIFTDVARAVCVLGLIGAHLVGSLPLLFSVLVVLVAFSGVFIPTRLAVIPEVTKPHELPVAMALSGGTWSVMLALGAAVGGLFTAWVGVQGALLLDAGTYLLSGLILSWLPPLPAPDRGTGDDEGDGRGFLDALRYLRGRVYLPAVLTVKAGMALSNGAMVLLPLFGNGVFQTGGPAYIGLLYSARGLGALCGSMGVRRVVGDTPEVMQRALVFGYLGTGTALFALSQAPSIGWAAAGYLIAGVGNGMVWVFSGTLAQHATESHVRGRLFSLEFGVMTLVSASVSWTAGLADDVLGLEPRTIMACSGLVLLLPAVAWTLVLSLAPDLEGRRREAVGGLRE